MSHILRKLTSEEQSSAVVDTSLSGCNKEDSKKLINTAIIKRDKLSKSSV